MGVAHLEHDYWLESDEPKTKTKKERLQRDIDRPKRDQRQTSEKCFALMRKCSAVSGNEDKIARKQKKAGIE